MQYEFEGGVTNPTELSRKIKAYGRDKLTAALEAGCTTTLQLMNFLSEHDRQAAARRIKGSKAKRRPPPMYTRKAKG